MFYALHRIHHIRRPGTIRLPVGLSDWLLWSCQADCLSHFYVCRVVRLPAMKLSCWLPLSWANQCCPVHMTHDSAMRATAPVWRNRSREWISQQASGPLQRKWVHCLVLTRIWFSFCLYFHAVIIDYGYMKWPYYFCIRMWRLFICCILFSWWKYSILFNLDFISDRLKCTDILCSQVVSFLFVVLLLNWKHTFC